MTDDSDERCKALETAALETLAIRAGHERTMEDEHSEPLYMTSSFVAPDAATAAARFAGDSPGNVYSRYTNPTVRIFEERLARLEGAEAAVATASGMAAILSTFMALLETGDHIVCSRSVFGATVQLINRYLVKFGVDVSFVDLKDSNAWRAAVRPETRILFCETPSNPLSEIADIEALGAIARDASALLVVDNCFCTPALQQPLALGADLVVHSATKYIDGQGRCLGGVVAGRHEHVDKVATFLRSAGPSMSPFNAWVFLKGLETLKLRMEAHSRQALELAQWLQQQTGIEQVYYAGLETHPQHALAARQQSAFGGVLSFRIAGDRAAAWRFIDATRIMSITANLGDVKTTIVHPASTTHGRLTEEQRLDAGISQNLIRVSVGLEALDDLKADLKRGLGAL